MRTSRRTRVAALAAAVLSTTSLVSFGQVSGSWTFNGNGNWSDGTMWSCAPLFPTSSGTASFVMHERQTGSRAVTLDVPVTLNGIAFDSAYQWTISGSQSLTLTAPATIDVPKSNGSAPGVRAADHTISRPIAGTSGLEKTGAGVLSLAGANTFSGTITLTGGVLGFAPGFSVGPSTINFNGGRLRIEGGNLTSSLPINIVSGAGTIEVFNNSGSFTNVIAGSGNLNKTGNGAATFSAASTFTGVSNFQAFGTLEHSPLGVALATGSITFRGSGSALNTSAINSGATIAFNNAATNLNDRLPSVPTNLHGSGIWLVGNSGADTHEVLGDITLTTSQTFFTVQPNAARSAKLTLSSLTGQNSATSVFRGPNLGSAPGPGVANIYLATPPHAGRRWWRGRDNQH